jgi:hypothetical protein
MSRGLVVSLIVVALAAAGYLVFQRDFLQMAQEPPPATTAQSAERPVAPGELTEEAWTIMEVCDQIVFLLRPEAIAQPVPENRITAARNQTQPVSYAVTAGATKGTITLNSSVWDPATYQEWCKAVATPAAEAPAAAERSDMLTILLKPDIATFLAQDARLSAELAKSPRQPEIYTDAALLLGTMAWLDGGGYFQDVRPLLNRMMAFLAVGDALGAKGKNRELAEILRLVLVHDQVAALEKITAARTAGNLPKAWLDALEVTTTGDWRKTEPLTTSGPLLLQLAHFQVLTQNMGANKAESFLRALSAPPTEAVWVRSIAQTNTLSIGQGHVYSRAVLGLEAQEGNTIAKALGLPADSGKAFIALMMKFDGKTAYERAPQAQVVGLPLWAGQTQRHFLDAIVMMGDFLQNRLGSPDDAAEFSAAMRKDFAPAYYYPFVTIKIERPASMPFKEALAAADKIAREHPATVAPKLWVELKPETSAGMARQSPDFHRFFNPELPRHTSFEAGKRIYEIGVGDENNLPLLKSILVRCPYDYGMASHTATIEGRPNDVAAKELENDERFAATHRRALEFVAKAVEGNPQKYERIKLSKAEWDPNAYIELSSYFADRGDIARGEKYLLLAQGKVDAVYFANACGFLVKHYAKTGRMEAAATMAEEAGDTYSASGLLTLGWLQEYRQQWKEAAETYKAIDERYEGRTDSVGYILRRKIAGVGWSPEYQSTLDAYFPQGVQKVTLAALGTAAPTTGARFAKSSPALQKSGLGPKDIIVAVDGVRVDNSEQYFAARALSDDAEMVLLVWDGQAYSQITANQPGRRFGVDVLDYKK